MIALVKVHGDRQIPAGVFLSVPVVTDNAYVDVEHLEEFIEIGFCVVENDIINMAYSTEKSFSFNDALHRSVFIRAVE